MTDVVPSGVALRLSIDQEAWIGKQDSSVSARSLRRSNINILKKYESRVASNKSHLFKAG